MIITKAGQHNTTHIPPSPPVPCVSCCTATLQAPPAAPHTRPSIHHSYTLSIYTHTHIYINKEIYITVRELLHRRLAPRAELLDEGQLGVALEQESLLLLVELLQAVGFIYYTRIHV